MERARIVLYGSDPFETLRISDVNLPPGGSTSCGASSFNCDWLYIPASVSAGRLRI